MKKLITNLIILLGMIMSLISVTSPRAMAADPVDVLSFCKEGGPAASSDVCTNYNKTATDATFFGIDGTVGKITKALVYLIGSFTVIYGLLGAYKLISSGGNDNKIKAGKTQITNALIGFVIVLLAPLIIRLVLSFVQN